AAIRRYRQHKTILQTRDQFDLVNGIPSMIQDLEVFMEAPKIVIGIRLQLGFGCIILAVDDKLSQMRKVPFKFLVDG
ncbi:MAG: hypothetical protein ACYTF1_21040, partial [Planctomycetota bacterium]